MFLITNHSSVHVLHFPIELLELLKQAAIGVAEGKSRESKHI